MQQPIDQPESPYEQLRRAQNAVSIGTVAEVRTAKPARCRVKVGDTTTDWIPWLTLRAGGPDGTFWWPPKVGEQVMVLAPGGDMRQAAAVPGVFSDSMSEPDDIGTSATVMLMRWGDKKYMRYGDDRLQFVIGKCLLEITPDRIHAATPGASFVLNYTGLHVTPEVDVGPIKLTEHKHLGVITGPMVSGVPTP